MDDTGGVFKAIGEPWSARPADPTPVGPRQDFDCQTCGACCCNTERNLGTSRDYVAVTVADELFHRPDLLAQLTVENDDGARQMRLVGVDERCVGLDGDVGVAVGCSLYAVRPGPCRLVEVGGDECLRARRFKGVVSAPRS